MFYPNADTRYVVIFGNPLKQTLSPLLHNTVFESKKMNNLYYPLEIQSFDDLSKALKTMHVFNVIGANVTMPYKEKVIELLDGLDKSAEQCGAVNTVVTTEKGLIGYNTDGMGFLNSFMEEFNVSPEGKTLLLIGAGGAAKAVVFAFLNAGVSKVIVYNNSQTRAMSLLERVEKFFPGKCEWRPLNNKPVPPEGIAEADIIINATKVGMKGEAEGQSLVLPDSFRPGQFVCDVVYNPPETKLLADAKKAGCKILSGDGMLVYQAAAAFKLWFGKGSDVKLMKGALESYFKCF